uniref:Branched-chain-amino-acid aminotransferase n=1 Tax=Palpitomonas bilix TaxID=652834 RepID=A0A7S3DGK7_9EUKA|mmetsp:Transcript_36795/g.95279  ORF Transcript_36795/g.95279 Transcript_36795/m.95279 type:complete len:396 (+) Transcript_36795:98-1285(+)
MLRSFARSVLAARNSCVTSFKATSLRALSTVPNLTTQLKPDSERWNIPPHTTLKFGHTFTDHMLVMDWNKEKGWNSPQIKPFGDFSIHPAAQVFHYGTELFEGMKAYKDADGELRLFRPMKNMERLENGARRMALPDFDKEHFLECIKELVRVDEKWVPQERGYSLYIRPTFIATTPFLGVAPANDARLFCILSPVGPYFPRGFQAVGLWATTKYARAWPGGSGNVKAGGNYAITMTPQKEAQDMTYDQVLWLYSDAHEITECGAMNCFIYLKNENGEDELVTPPLDGLTLPGVTRDSILNMTREWNEFKVSERKITMEELVKAVDNGRVYEAFGAGTAAIVSPINRIGYEGRDLSIPLDPENPNEQAGKLARRIMETIMDIQYGKIEHEWSVKI